MTVNWQRFREVVQGHERFLLTSHIRPDCDALGSELGMAGVLESLGKDVRIVHGQSTPPNLSFIDPADRIQAIDVDVSASELEDRQILMVLDTSAWAQLGPMGEVVRTTAARKIILDHHVSGDDLGAEPFKDVQAEATGVLVAKAAEEMGVSLTPQIATPLFAAVATDTGWFRFASVTSETYRTAAKLIDAGASPVGIYGDLYEQNTLGRMRLRGMILARIIAELDGALAHTYVLSGDYEQAGALPTDTEDVINMAMAISGVQFAAIFVEQQSGGFKISFRSRCELDCSEIAEQFGGGGHKAAAGAFLEGTLVEVQSKVLGHVRDNVQGTAGVQGSGLSGQK